MWEQWKWFGAAVWGDQSFCSKWVWNDQSLRWKISDIPKILLDVIQRGAEGIHVSTNKYVSQCAPSGNATQCDILWYVVIKLCWIMSAMFLCVLCYVCPDAKLMPVSHGNVTVWACPCGIALFFICYQTWVCYLNNMKRSHEMWCLWSNNKTLLRNHDAHASCKPCLTNLNFEVHVNPMILYAKSG